MLLFIQLMSKLLKKVLNGHHSGHKNDGVAVPKLTISIVGKVTKGVIWLGPLVCEERRPRLTRLSAVRKVSEL